MENNEGLSWSSSAKNTESVSMLLASQFLSGTVDVVFTSLLQLSSAV